MRPLRILVLHHPESSDARALAEGLFKTFSTDLGGPGLRIPVALTPWRSQGQPPEMGDLGLNQAKQTLAILLVDERMRRRAHEHQRLASEKWAALARALVAHFERTREVDGLLPIALDSESTELCDALPKRSFVRLDRVNPDFDARLSELVLHVASTALRFLRNEPLLGKPDRTAPITLFISHAKSDYSKKKNKGPIEELLGYLQTKPVSAWFDEKDIPAGSRFDDEIEKGTIRCDALVAVLTDSWSEREWCRREVLMAKRRACPVIVVDALEDGAPRLFPYLGNSRVLRWAHGKAQVVVLAALVESLRHAYAHAVLEARRHDADHVLATHPEALTLMGLVGRASRVVHPDPPLPDEELEALLPVVALDPHVRDGHGPPSISLTTPLSELARWQAKGSTPLIGLSLSGAADLGHFGASTGHLATLADDLATMLLFAGAQLAYGGVLDHGGTQAGDINYTRRLFALVRSYSPLLKAGSIKPIVNFVPWPIHLAYGDEEEALYGHEAELRPGPDPKLDDEAQRSLQGKRGASKARASARRFALARGATEMREAMAGAIHARVALAGKLEAYGGTLPGVLEEILLALRNAPRIPVFLIGAYGGATRYSIDLLEGRPREEATTAWVTEHVPGYEALVGEYRRRSLSVTTPEEAAGELHRIGEAGPGVGLGNGLSDAENRELFFETDGYRIVELVLTGLQRRFSNQGSPPDARP